MSPVESLKYVKGKFHRIRRDPEFDEWAYFYTGSNGNTARSPQFPSYAAARRHQHNQMADVICAVCDGGERTLWTYREYLPAWLLPLVRVRLRRKEGIPRKKWTWKPEARQRVSRVRTGKPRSRQEEIRRLTLLLIAAL